MLSSPSCLSFSRGLKEFLQLVFGMTNTVPLIKQGKIGKQAELAEKYLTGEEWKPLVEAAHDALIDCKLLHGLLAHFKVTEEDLKNHVLPIRDYFEDQAKKKTKANNLPPLKVLLQHGVSKVMVGKMATGGVTLEELHREYDANGRKGLEVCLGVQLDGKPRVTTSSKIITTIEEYLKL